MVLALAFLGASVADATVTGLASTPDANGYWLVHADGAVVPRGTAAWYSDMAGRVLNKPISAIVAMPDAGGYRLIGRDGGAFNFGSARALSPGSLAGQSLNAEIVGAVGSPSGNGYRMVGADGGVFDFGDSQGFGSLGSTPPPPSGAIVAVAATPSANGYWLAGRDGRVYAFGDAALLPDARGLQLNRPITGIAAHGGDGYWLLAADGGVFAYGSAPFLGGLANRTLPADAVAIASTPSPAGGFRVALADGTVEVFGGAAGPVTVPPPTQALTTGASQPPAPVVAGPQPPRGTPRLSRWPRVALFYTAARQNNRERLLSVDFAKVVNVVRGATVRLLCSSGRQPCPFARSTTRIARSSGVVTFRARRTLGRATIKVLVTKRGRLGSYTSWRLRRGELVSQVKKTKRRACVLHGSTRATACG